MPADTAEILIRARNLTGEAFTAAKEDLRGIGKEADGAGAKLRKMGDTSVGSMSDMRGAAKELMGALGLAFSIDAVVDFGREILRMGDEIQKSADKTGLATEEVQRLQFVASQTGVSFEGMIGAVQNLEQRLGSGDKGAVGAMKALGINVNDFLKLDPYQQFLTVADAVGKIEDPTQRAAVSADVFGKSWKEITPAIVSNIRQLANEAPVMSDKTVKALDAAGDALDKFKLTAKVWAAEAYNFLGRMFDLGVAAIYRYVGSVYDSVAGILSAFAKIPGAEKVFTHLQDTIKGAGEKAQWFKDAAALMEKPIDNAGHAATRATPPIVNLGKASKDTGAAHHEHAKAAREVVEVSAEMQHALDLVAIANRHAAAAAREAAAAEHARFVQMGKDMANIPHGVQLDRQDPGTLTSFGDMFANGLPGLQLAVEKAPKVPGFFEKVFGTKTDFGNYATGLFAQVFGHGGGLMSSLKNFGTQFAKDFTGQLLSFIPGIGPMLSQFAGPLVDGVKKLFGSLFDRNKGRDLVKGFVEDTFGTFDAMHAKLGELGAEGERLWIKLTQGVGRNNPEQAKAAIAEVTKALEDQKTKQQDVQHAAEQASQAQLDAQQKVRDSIKSLDDQMTSLLDSIKDEAPEEVMGVIEQQTREKIAALAKEREAAQAHLDAMTNAATEAANAVAEAVRNIPHDIEVRIRTTYDGDPGGVPQHAIGAYIRQDHIAQVHGGEIVGPIDFMTRALVGAMQSLTPSGAGAPLMAAAAGGAGMGDMAVHVYVGNEQLDARTVRVARRAAVTGRLRTRAGAGRSY